MKNSLSNDAHNDTKVFLAPVSHYNIHFIAIDQIDVVDYSYAQPVTLFNVMYSNLAQLLLEFHYVNRLKFKFSFQLLNVLLK